MRTAHTLGWGALAALIVAAICLYLLRGILPPFLLALAVAYALRPVVGWLERRFQFLRWHAVVFLYLVALTPAFALTFWVLPPLVDEVKALAAALPALTGQLFRQVFGSEQLEVLGVVVRADAVATSVVERLGVFLGAPQGGRQAAGAFVDLAGATFVFAVVLAYLLVDRERLEAAALGLLPAELAPRVSRVAKQADRPLLRYLWSLVLLAFLSFLATWAAFGGLLGLPYALSIALATGLLAPLPGLGLVVAGLLAVALCLALGSLEAAVLVVLFYCLIGWLLHQSVLVTGIGRGVAPHPVVAIFAVLAGATLAGMLGFLFAMPLVAIAKVAVVSWRGEVEAAGAVALS